MMARAIIVGFLLLIYCINNISASVIRNISTDKSALLAFKAQITNDPNEILSKNWTQQGTTVCSWIGVSRSTKHQRVVALNLKSLRLGGNLPLLQSLFMAHNHLVGELPSGLDKCTQLKYLSLSYNRFTGNLPRDMWNMSKLEDMFLGWNNLSGKFYIWSFVSRPIIPILEIVMTPNISPTRQANVSYIY
uniref:Receptor-like protein kinase At3g47110 isoform X2 n=1 Tax=Nicotiana sylvestris TaxID=4096 RepID=A0A1U7YIK3_NICSY|nr:PREDICTED: putative receptor-like protein kinase At3g47110 isoform X2 [Nicotiana sylvestris]